MKKHAIIVAGGTGSRMGVETPKQFLLLNGLPVLMYAIRAFHQYDPEIKIIVSLHPDFFETWNNLCSKYTFSIRHQLVPGGETRFHSVKNALAIIPGDGLIAVHDGARPLVTNDLISRSYREAEEFLSSIPVIPVNETVRQIKDEKAFLVDRSSLRIIQTPQIFEASLLHKAYHQEYQSAFTDDASVLEAMGVHSHLTDGDPRNIKITLPSDILIAEALIKTMQ